MITTNDLQPALVEKFLETSRGATTEQRTKVAARIRGMVDNKQTTTVDGTRVSEPTWLEIVKRLEAK